MAYDDGWHELAQKMEEEQEKAKQLKQKNHKSLVTILIEKFFGFFDK